jgi:hypothetical protein
MIKLNFSMALAGVLWLSTPACGSDGGGETGAGGSGNNSGGTSNAGTSNNSSGGGDGTTSCGVTTCQAGQYCNNGVCVNGCLTDANCGPNQSCQDIDDVTSQGTCRNTTNTPAKDCNAFCAKAVACNAPEADQCMQVCEAISAECAACVIDSNCGTGCDAECAF